MKLITIKLTIMLSLMTFTLSSTFATEHVQKSSEWLQPQQEDSSIDSLSVSLNRYDSYDPQFVRQFNVNTLFKVHRLPRDLGEARHAEELHTIGERLLEEKKWESALHYLACADYFRVPRSVETLWLIRDKDGIYDAMPKSLRDKVDKACSDVQSRMKLADDIIEYKLQTLYEKLWNLNKKNLRSPSSSVVRDLKTQGTRMEGCSSDEYFSQKDKATSPRTSREGSTEDLIPLLPGEMEKVKKD